MPPEGRSRVLIGPSSFGEADPAPLEALARAGLEVVPNPFKRRLTKDELLALLGPEVVGLIAGLEPVDREVLSRSKLKAVSRCGSGVSNVDLKAAADLGVAVRWTPEAPVEAVAELTVAALLALLRGLPAMDRDVHAGRWEKRTGRQLSDMTVAVVGFGRIGRRTARLVSAFGARVLAVDPALPQGADGFPGVGLREALKSADAVLIHAAGEDRLLGAPELGWMKPGAFLLNAARGGVVDEAALAEALRSGRLAGAWLDVFEKEPYAGPLASEPKALLTPHAGSYTAECRGRMELEAAENLVAALGRA